MISGHSTDENPRLKILSLVPKAGAQKILDHKRMEVLATDVAGEFRAHVHKLSALRPSIERIKDYFRTNVRGSVTLAGCGSFKEYCEKKLGRTEQAVYAMLGSYSLKRKEKNQRMPKAEREHEDHVPKEAVVRMRMAIDKVQQIRQAKTKEEWDAGWREYDQIAAAQPLAGAMDEMNSKIDHDEPDYRRLLRDVLVTSLQLLSAVKNIVEAGVLDEGSALLAQAMAALQAGKILTAVHEKRLKIVPTLN